MFESLLTVYCVSVQLGVKSSSSKVAFVLFKRSKQPYDAFMLSNSYTMNHVFDKIYVSNYFPGIVYWENACIIGFHITPSIYSVRRQRFSPFSCILQKDEGSGRPCRHNAIMKKKSKPLIRLHDSGSKLQYFLTDLKCFTVLSK